MLMCACKRPAGGIRNKAALEATDKEGYLHRERGGDSSLSKNALQLIRSASFLFMPPDQSHSLKRFK